MRKLRQPYTTPELNEATKALALTGVILDTGVTYREAIEALEYAQRLIESETKPTRR